MKETQKNEDNERKYCDREFSATPIRRGVKCGIDNPAFSCDDIGREEGQGAWPRPEGAWPRPEGAGPRPEGEGLRLCYLERSRRGQRLGFSIERDALGVLVSHVTAGGLAEGAELRVGDVILHVNGWPLPHDVTIDHVWAKIKAPLITGGLRTTTTTTTAEDGVALLVSDRHWDPRRSTEWVSLGGPPPLGAAGGAEIPRKLLEGLPRRPRVATLERHPVRGYGFYLREIRGIDGQFIHDVERGSAAERGGLREGDRLVAVNGVSVGHVGHGHVVQAIRAAGGRVQLVLVDSATHVMCSRIGISPLAFLPCLEPHRGCDNDRFSEDDSVETPTPPC